MPDRLMTKLEHARLWVSGHVPWLLPKKRGGFLYYLFVVVLMSLALLARLAIAPVEAGLQYLTFFPAVAIAAIVSGLWPGMFAVAIGLAMATFIFEPPYWTVSLEVIMKGMWSNAVFLLDGLIVCISIEALHRYRIQLQQESKEAKESELRIQLINKELDDFTYIASHDLKEPLRGIHNYASFLKDDFGDDLKPEARQYVDNMQRLAERMTNLIDRLLEYSRLGSSMKMGTVDMDDIVDNVFKDLSSLRDAGVELRRVGKLGKTQGDAIRIGEVFQNLIVNAAKYNDKPVRWVEVGCGDSDTYPFYYVRDNGIGIKPEHQDIVFRIFKRLHEQNKYGGGTGAGLTIVKKIIERHGGRIWLESAPGAGTTFYFTLTGEHTGEA